VGFWTLLKTTLDVVVLGLLELAALLIRRRFVSGGEPSIVQPEAAPKPVGWLARAALALVKPVGAVHVPPISTSAVVQSCMPMDLIGVVDVYTVKSKVYVVVAFVAAGLDELKVKERLVS
jgi:hypothetical protein